jgi:hypothetical protein
VGAGFSQSLLLLLEDYSFPHTFITLPVPPSLSEGSFGILLRGNFNTLVSVIRGETALPRSTRRSGGGRALSRGVLSSGSAQVRRMHGACLDAGSATGSGTAAVVRGVTPLILPPRAFMAHLVAATSGDSAPSAPVHCLSGRRIFFLCG